MKTPINSTTSKLGRLCQIKILTLAAALAVPAATGLAQNYWQGPTNGSADYNIATNWVGNVVPTGSSANPANDNGSNSVILIQAGDPAWSVNSLRAGWENNAAGTYLQTGGTLTTTLKVRLAAGNSGTANNSPDSGSFAFYTLSNGVINCGSDFNVGELGTAVLNVNGGAINVNGGNNFGDNNYNGAGNSGVNSVTDVVNQTAGIITISSGQLFVGNGGPAIYNLSGGSNIVDNYIAFGRSGGNGTFNMTGGLLAQNAGGANLLVGSGYQNPAGGTPWGVLNQSGGTITDQGQFLCPEESPATGTYNLSGTGALIANNWLVFGRSGGVGVLNMTGGTITGNTSGGGNFEIGETTPGTVNQSGGTVTMNMQTWVGQGGGAAGTYNLSGTGTYIANNWFAVGRQGGVGVLNLTNGLINFTPTGAPILGNTVPHFDIGAGGHGTLNQFGGTISNTASVFYLGETATGTWNMNGGSDYLNLLLFTVGPGGGSDLELNGGLIQLTGIVVGTNSSPSILNFNGGTLQANANNASFISGLYQAEVSPGGAVIDSQGYNITIAQALQDNGGGLTKNGTGTLTLTGANSYSGDTVVTSGTLLVNTGSGASGNYTVADNAGLGVLVQSAGAQLAAQQNVTLGSSTGASLNFDMGAFGNPSLSQAPLYVGGTFTVNGTIIVNVADALPQLGEFPLVKYQPGGLAGGGNFVLGSLPVGVVANIVTNGGNNSIDLNISSVNLPRWEGLAGGNWDIGVTTNWINIGTGLPTTYGDGNAVVFDDNATGTTNVNLVANVAPGSVTINNSSLVYTLTGTGSINGPTGLLKEGAGSFTIQTANGYTGTTMIAGGTLSVNNLANGGSTSAIGAASSSSTNLVLSTGTLSYTGPAVSINRGYSLQNTNNTIDTEGNLTLSGAAATAASSDFIKTGPAQLTYATLGVNALSGVSSLGYRTIQGTTKFDGSSGGQTNNVLGHFGVGGLGGTNATVILTNTTLNVTTAGVDLGRSGGATGTLAINSGAVFNATGGNFALGDGGGVSSTGVVNQAGGTVNTTGQIFIGQNNNGAGVYNLSGGTLNVNNWLAIGRQGGTGTFNLSGTGVLFDAGGGGGNLDIGTSAGVGGYAGSGTLNQTGGAITNTASQTWLGEGVSGEPAAGTWNMSGGTAQLGEVHVGVGGTGTSTLNVSGTATIVESYLLLANYDTNTTGNVNIGSASQPGGTVTVNADMNVGGQGTGTLNLVTNGGGKLTVTGTVYLSRSSPVANGTVNLNAGGTLVSGNINNGWAFNEGTNSPTFNPNAFNFNGGTWMPYGTYSYMFPNVNAVVQAGGAIINDNGNSVEVGAALVAGGGGGGLTKLGAGTLLLDGVNTYTGTTLVSAGTLGVGPNAAIAGPVTVAAGATLAGDTGSIETFSINNALTLSNGCMVLMKVTHSGSYDQIVGMTSAAYGGALVVTNTGAAPLQAGDTFQLFHSSAPRTGGFSSITILPLGSGTFDPATGILTITSVGNPAFNPVTLSGGNLILTGMGGAAGTGYTLLTSTNLATPTASWATNTTGTFDGGGNFSNAIPVSVSTPAQFFRIRTP